MVHFLEVAELVDHQIFRQFWRQLGDAEVKVEVPLTRTATPTRLLLLDADGLIRESVGRQDAPEDGLDQLPCFRSLLLHFFLCDRWEPYRRDAFEPVSGGIDPANMRVCERTHRSFRAPEGRTHPYPSVLVNREAESFRPCATDPVDR